MGFYFFIKILKIFNWNIVIYNALFISTVQQSDSGIYIYTHTPPILFLHILFHYDLSQDIEYSSLGYTVGSCSLSILYVITYIC